MRIGAQTMLMPETAMNEDYFARGGKNDVRLSGKVGTMQTITKTEAMDQPADKEFGFGIFAADAPHVCAAAMPRDRIHGILTQRASLLARGFGWEIFALATSGPQADQRRSPAELG